MVVMDIGFLPSCRARGHTDRSIQLAVTMTMPVLPGLPNQNLAALRSLRFVAFYDVNHLCGFA
jgi:hypothetical protein